MAYWFNTATNTVQTDADRGQDIDVLGPYATEAEARRFQRRQRLADEVGRPGGVVGQGPRGLSGVGPGRDSD